MTYRNKEIKNDREKLMAQGFSDVGAHGFLGDLAERFGIDLSDNCKNP